MASINFLGFIPLEQIKASGITYDTAIPQDWVNITQNTLNYEGNIPMHFVYVYPKGNIFGGLMPIDIEGATIIRQLSEV